MNVLRSVKKLILFLFLLNIVAISNLFAFNDLKKVDNKDHVNLIITVHDSSSATPLELVNLILKKENSIVEINITNPQGIAVFHDIAPGDYTLLLHYIGYQNQAIPIIVNHKNDRLAIKLKEAAIGLGEVVVSASKISNISSYVDMKTGNKTFETETYHAAPSSRMTTLIQENLTGAVRAPTGEVHIRGQHGEYTYYVDGIPIPLGVFGGLNEIVDPKVIKQITFYTGGFPAEYGGQIAALMNIQNRVPSGRFHLNFSSYVGSYLTANHKNLGDKVGAFKSINSNGQSLSFSNHIDKFGYFISGSRQETDRRIDQPVEQLFQDHGFDYFLYGKFDYLLGDDDYLTSNINFSRTQTQVPYDPAEGLALDDQNSYNSFQTLSYYHTFENDIEKETKLFVGLYSRQGGLTFSPSLYDGNRTFLNNDTTKGFVVSQDRSFYTFGLITKFDQRLTHHFSYAAGINYSGTNGKEKFDFMNPILEGPQIQSNYSGYDFGVFTQTNFHPIEKMKLELGIRYDQHKAPNLDVQDQISPRVKLSLFSDLDNTFYASYDKLFMPTNIEALSSIAGILGGFSQFSTLPEKDDLFEIGWIHNYGYGFNTKLDGFYKESKPGLDDETLGSSSIKVNVNIAKIHITGIEFGLTYSSPENPLSGYINSSLIHAYGNGPVSGGFLEPDNSTQPFDLDHDQRLSVVVGLNYQPQNWFANIVAIYGSGLANGNYSYNFKTGLFDFNQGAHTTPAWIINISGGYKFILANGNSIEPSLYITNLLDHAHLIKGSFFSGASFEERRNVTLRISYNI